MVIKIYVERGIVPRRCSRKGAMKKKRKRKEKGDDEIEIERPPPSFYREAARESAIYVERRYVKQRGRALTMSFDLLVRSVNVLAGAVSARVSVAFVDVVRAIRPRKAGCTRALVAVLQR